MPDSAGHQIRRIAGSVDCGDIDRIRIRQCSDVGDRIGRIESVGRERGRSGCLPYAFGGDNGIVKHHFG